MLTKAQLRRFVQRRNQSGFNTNLQFQIDANECGFKVSDLGDVTKLTVDGFTAYLWNVPTKKGTVKMLEIGRSMLAEGISVAWPDAEQIIARATVVPAEAA